MITEFERGMLEGYLINAPDHVVKIVRKLLTEIIHPTTTMVPVANAIPDIFFEDWVESAELPTRVKNCLKYYDYWRREHSPDSPEINTFRDLLASPKVNLLKMPNFGRKSLEELEYYIRTIGFRWKQKNG